MCNCTYGFAPVMFIWFFLTILSGCENSDVKATTNVVESDTQSALIDKIEVSKTQESIPFAAIAETSRKGKWLGGAPPLNKRASGIDTYYRIISGGEANHLTMTLRFEGIVADDAKVTFRPIDGARFEFQDQPSQWRLKPNHPSEVTFNVVVPDNISYLALHTYQNGYGTSRAFSLKIPSRGK